jgi:hypothetical protein
MTPERSITIPVADYRRLLEAAEADDMIVTCEVCGAWLDRADPTTATTDDFVACWKAATCDPRYATECKSYRAIENEPSPNSGISPDRIPE